MRFGGMAVAGAFLAISGCKSLAAMANADAGAGDTELAAQMPSPTNANANFAVGDAVSVIEEDGTFSIEATVQAVGGKLVFVTPAAGNASRLQKAGWVPVAEAANQPQTKTAERGYQLRVGNSRSSSTTWFPAPQVFPAPWAGCDNIQVGGTFYQRHFGSSFPATKCTVTEKSATNQAAVTAKCEGSDTPTRVNREDMAPFFKVPTTLADVQPGQIVYFDNMYWAIVVGKQDPRPVIRQNGFASKDKAVDLTKIALVR